MRYIRLVIFMLFWMNTSQAQIFEVGPYLGGANFIGDVGSTNYINPNSIAFGGIVKWNRSPRHAWRATLIHTALKFDDAESDSNRRRERGYSFSYGLTELTLGMEFTFWDWSIYSSQDRIVPYLSTGISGIFTHDLYVGQDDELTEKKDKFGL